MEKKQILDLINECNKILTKSYSPYSNFPVSAIVIDKEGNKYYGVNIENASYGLSICAERNAISSAVYNGVRVIDKIIVSAEKVNKPVSPCGMCRQVIYEFSDENTEIILTCKNKEYKVFKVDEILPYGFDKTSLEK